MQRKPQSELAQVVPNVPFVILASLFGFPGAGHIMVGRKAAGLAYLAVFGMGFLGMVYELAILLPQMVEVLPEMARGQLTLPAWKHPVLVLIWGSISAAAWAMSGLHAGWLAYRKTTQSASTSE